MEQPWEHHWKLWGLYWKGNEYTNTRVVETPKDGRGTSDRAYVGITGWIYFIFTN